MKFRFLVLLLSTILYFTQDISAQVDLYGSTGIGGKTGGGSIFKLSSCASDVEPVFPFEAVDGHSPVQQSQFFKSSNGKFYWVVGFGAAEAGVIASYDPVKDNYEVVYAFDKNGPEGLGDPTGKLAEVNGKLYGVCSDGGPSVFLGEDGESGPIFGRFGGVYSFDLASGKFAPEYFFKPAEGTPNGGLTAVNGIFYGSSRGGAYSNSAGSIYSFDPSARNLTVLKSFTFDFAAPNSPKGEVIYQNGKLYGAADGGGNEWGVLYEHDLTPNATSPFKVLHNFGFGDDGKVPTGYFTLYNGVIYGTALEGGGETKKGTIFSYDPANGGTYEQLYAFDQREAQPVNGVISDGNGKLFGSTAIGEASPRPDEEAPREGVIYSFDITARKYTKIYQFVAPSGVFGVNIPDNPLLLEGGKLYGNANVLGIGSGIVFSINPDGSNFRNIHSYRTNRTGNFATGMTKIEDMLYGVTTSGGKLGNGTIFSYDPNSNQYIILHDFEPGVGGYPPIKASNGKLYGITIVEQGGQLYSFDPITREFIILKTFSSENLLTDGFSPVGTLLELNGRLYGICEFGGQTFNGVIFSNDLQTGQTSTVHHFDGDNGASPVGGLIEVGGLIYGVTTVNYTTGDGNVFSFDPGSGVYTRLADVGGSIKDIVVTDAGNQLYGVTKNGGTNGMGTIFSYNISTGEKKVLHEFSGTEGREPISRLIFASDNKFYGMTNAGGVKANGIIYSFDPAGTTLKFLKIADFDENTLGVPHGSFLVEFSKPDSAKFFRSPDEITCLNEEVTYAAQPGRANYVWTVAGVENTDYKIISGGLLTSDSTVTIAWKTTGSKEVKVSYSCSLGEAKSTTTVIATPNASVALTSDDADNTIIKGTAVVFTATPTNGGVTPTYQWLINNVPTSSTSSTFSSTTLSNNDVVKVVLTSSETCVTSGTASSSITMTVYTPPSQLAYDPNTLVLTNGTGMTPITPTYVGDEVTSFTLSGTLPDGLIFNTTTGEISGTPTSLQITPVVYTVTATNKGGSATTTFTLSVIDAPPSNLVYNPSNQRATKNTQITPMLPSVSGGPIDSYSISPGLPAGLTFDTATGIISGTLTASLTGSVEYTITASNSGGSTTAKVTIVYNAPPTDIQISRATLYEGNALNALIGLLNTTDPDAGDTHVYTLVSGAGSADNGAFRISGNQLLANRVYNHANKNSYTIRVRTTDNGALYYDEIITITIHKLPAVTGRSSESYYNTVSGNPVISKGFSTQLQVTGNGIASVNWSPSTGLSATNILNPIAKPLTTTTYTVTITNNDGSVAVVYITVEVKDDYIIKPSNVLTPNADGFNDFWKIENIENYPDADITLFDRNGRILHKVTNYNNRWDGKINGKPLSTGTYYYLIQFKNNPAIRFKGFISIVNN